MAIESRLRELDAKHRDLEARIEDAKKHPSVDWTEISELKRVKLKLKEELETLRRRDFQH
jgi:hypothetical protein